MTFHEAGRSIRQNGGAAAVRYEVSKGLAMDKVPLSDLEDLKERHKENVETAKMPHASGDSDITALQEGQDRGIISFT